MKRWPLVLLIVSLVLNVFLIGLIGGTIWHWTHDRGMGFRNGWRMRVAESLPPDKARELRETIHDTVRQSLPRLRASGAARAEAGRLFVQPQFDANAINAKLDQARASDMMLRTDIEHRIVQFASTLPLDQRKKMAEALKEGPFRQGPRHPHDMGGPPGGPPPPR